MANVPVQHQGVPDARTGLQRLRSGLDLSLERRTRELKHVAATNEVIALLDSRIADLRASIAALESKTP